MNATATATATADDYRPVGVPDDYVLPSVDRYGDALSPDLSGASDWCDPDDIVTLASGETADRDHCIYCEYSEEYGLENEETLVCYYDGNIVLDVFESSMDIACDVLRLDCHGYARGSTVEYADADECCETHDTGNIMLREDAYECENTGNYYEYQENMPSENDPCTIAPYASGAEPDYWQGIRHDFSIGFEVEKTDFDGARYEGDDVINNGLFAAVETDSSCGVEAVTHILPLSSDPAIADRVIAAMRDESVILNSDYNTDCGGHITVSARGIPPRELALLLVRRMGLIYSLWAPRLTCMYVGGAREPVDGARSKLFLGAVKDGNETAKYSPVNIKPYGVEIRVPGAVRTVDTLINRYRLFAAIIETLHESRAVFMSRVTPIVLDMYSSEERARSRLSRAAEYQRYIDKGEVTTHVSDATCIPATVAPDGRAFYVPAGWTGEHVSTAYEVNSWISRGTPVETVEAWHAYQAIPFAPYVYVAPDMTNDSLRAAYILNQSHASGDLPRFYAGLAESAYLNSFASRLLNVYGTTLSTVDAARSINAALDACPLPFEYFRETDAYHRAARHARTVCPL